MFCVVFGLKASSDNQETNVNQTFEPTCCYATLSHFSSSPLAGKILQTTLSLPSIGSSAAASGALPSPAPLFIPLSIAVGLVEITEGADTAEKGRTCQHQDVGLHDPFMLFPSPRSVPVLRHLNLPKSQTIAGRKHTLLSPEPCLPEGHTQAPVGQ